MAVYDQATKEELAERAASDSPLLTELRQEGARDRAVFDRKRDELDSQCAAHDAQAARIEELASRGLFGRSTAFEQEIERLHKATGLRKRDLVTVVADGLDAIENGRDG